MFWEYLAEYRREISLYLTRRMQYTYLSNVKYGKDFQKIVKLRDHSNPGSNLKKKKKSKSN